MDFEDYQGHLAKLRASRERQRQANDLAQLGLEHMAREMVVDPRWQWFADWCQGKLNTARQSVMASLDLLGRVALVGTEVERVRLGLIYQEGIRDILIELLGEVKRLTEKGESSDGGSNGPEPHAGQ